MVFVEPTSVSDMFAGTIKTDRMKRIFYTDKFREKNVVGRMRTIIHEASHLELHTADSFAYDGAGDGNLTFGEQATRSFSEYLEKNKILNGTVSGMRLPRGSDYEYHLFNNADSWAVFPLMMLGYESVMELQSYSVDQHRRIEGMPRNNDSFRFFAKD